ncbi:MAG: TonB-dependent receptor [Verrucomicrobia bacterium]|nr:TonB-dependent receptor [Verrucomicrobiota bacterium]
MSPNSSTPVRLARRVFHFLAAAAAVTVARAQTPPTQLAPFVTAATRTPADAQTIGSAVEVISAADLARRQVNSLAGALGGVTSAPLFASGAGGASASLFLRGANSNQTLFLIDGLRSNDPNTDYQVTLGGACVSACDSLEIAHGPQSTLYGGEAVGGVVSLRAQRGAGAPGGSVSFEAGSFGTVQGGVAAQGERGANAWNFSARGGHTDNDRPNNKFDSATTTLRLDHKVSDRAAVGGTLRWFHGVYGDPGDRYTNDPDNQIREENLLATAFADLKLADAWTAHAVLGGQDRRFVAESPRAGRATSFTVVKNRRAVLDAQTTYTGIERHRVTGGLTAEANHTRNTGFGDINKKQGLLAVFAQDEWSPVERVYLTGGLRSDDFDTFGRATTGRATAAWLAMPKTLKFRASYGTAFRSPSFLDLYGQSAFYVGNPNLHAERARGWDAGADYYLAAGRGTLSATWFNTDFTDLIASTPNFRSVENIQRARTRGAELSAQARLTAAIALRASFTYLEALNQTSNTRLLRRPRQSGALDAWRDFGGGVSAGAGVTFAAHRRDVHARTFAQIDQEDYTVTRVYAAWQVTPKLAFKVRFENLLNERYEEVNGYPALGFGAFGGVEWKF